MDNRESLGFLGKRVTDKATGLTGVITSISFDLSGCIQANIQPKVVEAKNPTGTWTDLNRIKVDDHIPVIDVPDFSNAFDNGPAHKAPK